MFCTVARYPSRQYLTTFRNISTQLCSIFVVDISRAVYAERTHAFLRLSSMLSPQTNPSFEPSSETHSHSVNVESSSLYSSSELAV